MTKILLYSDFRPNISRCVDDQMLSLLAGKGCRIGYIPSDSDTKRRYFSKVQDHYGKVGISDVVYFDLGEEFEPANIPALLTSDMIHLSGGDPLRFMELIKLRNFGEHLNKFLKGGGVLMGVSAGAMILSRSLGLLTLDEAAKSQSGRKDSKPPPKNGSLKYFDFEFYPHYKRDEKTTKKLVHFARSQKTIVYACDDDAGVLIKNGVVTMLGEVTRFDPNGDISNHGKTGSQF